MVVLTFEEVQKFQLNSRWEAHLEIQFQVSITFFLISSLKRAGDIETYS